MMDDTLTTLLVESMRMVTKLNRKSLRSLEKSGHHIPRSHIQGPGTVCEAQTAQTKTYNASLSLMLKTKTCVPPPGVQSSRHRHRRLGVTVQLDADENWKFDNDSGCNFALPACARRWTLLVGLVRTLRDFNP